MGGGGEKEREEGEKREREREVSSTSICVAGVLGVFQNDCGTTCVLWCERS